jgi:hypothetical protein
VGVGGLNLLPDVKAEIFTPALSNSVERGGAKEPGPANKLETWRV